MKVLVACEYSGIVRDEFLRKGHDAISCDLLDTETKRITGLNYLGGHYKGDVKDIINDGWDLLIAFPPCTYLTVSGNRWFYHPEDKHLPYEKRRPHPLHPKRRELQEEALDFIRLLMNAPIDKIAIENPIGVISSKIRKPDQIIQPYEYGHATSKSTCLWLKNLPLLQPTNIVDPEWIQVSGGKRMSRFHYDSYSLPKKERWKFRSRTFKGIAEAMAEQW
jgi:site-specific DNA-cytosine methylase